MLTSAALLIVGLTSIVLFVYGLNMLYLSWRSIWVKPFRPELVARGEEPMVAVQLPIYNERYVAERIIDAELERTVTAISERDTAAPAITALVEWAEALRAREIERTFGAGEALDAATRERVDVLTSSIVRKLLHGPVTRLREAAGDPATTLAIREAFRLDR